MPGVLALLVVLMLTITSGHPEVVAADPGPMAVDLEAAPTPDATVTPEATASPALSAAPEATATPEATASPVPSATPDATPTPEATAPPSPTEEPTPEPPATAGTATIDIVATFDPDGAGPKAAVPAARWLVSWQVVVGDEQDVVEEGDVRTASDGRATITVVTGPGLSVGLWEDVPSAYIELGTRCVDAGTEATVGESPFEYVDFTPAAGGRYSCAFANATSTAGVFLQTAFERTGVRNEDRGFNGESGVVVDITVDGGYPHHLTQASGDEGFAGTLIWLEPGHRTAQVTISERVPAGQWIIDGGCHLNDVRSDGLRALIPPWDVGMRGGRIALTVDRWHGADCVFVNAPIGVVLPQTDAGTDRLPPTLPLLALAAALGSFATRRRLAQ